LFSGLRIGSVGDERHLAIVVDEAFANQPFVAGAKS